jgi:hypothetical protein
MLDRYAAYLLIPLLGLPLPTVSSIRVGDLAVIALAPIILFNLAKRPEVRPLLWLLPALGLGSVIAAAFSTWYGDRTWNSDLAIQHGLLLANFACQLFGVLWASDHIGVRNVAMLYAATSILLFPLQGSLTLEDAWKYALASPVCIGILAFTARYSSWLRVAVLCGLAIFALFVQARNNAGILVLTALIASWPGMRGRLSILRASAAIGGIALLTVLAVLVVNSAITSGQFGDEFARRHAVQTENGVFGGRIEYGATVGLFLSDPLGLGLGVEPSDEDIRSGQLGLYAIGVGPDTEYIREEVLGDALELHSIAADLWAAYSLPGLVLALWMLVIMLRSLVVNTGGRNTKHLLLFVAIQGIWDLLFSPFHTNGTLLALTLGMLLAAGTRPRAARSRGE